MPLAWGVGVTSKPAGGRQGEQSKVWRCVLDEQVGDVASIRRCGRVQTRQWHHQLVGNVSHLTDHADLHACDDAPLPNNKAEGLPAVPVKLNHLFGLVPVDSSVPNVHDVAVFNLCGAIPRLRCCDPNS